MTDSSVQQACKGADAVIMASGPLTSDALAESLVPRSRGRTIWRSTTRRRPSSWPILWTWASCSAKAATRMRAGRWATT